MDLGWDPGLGLGAQAQPAPLGQALAQQRDVSFDGGGVAGEAQQGASSRGQRGGLVLGAS